LNIFPRSPIKKLHVHIHFASVCQETAFLTPTLEARSPGRNHGLLIMDSSSIWSPPHCHFHTLKARWPAWKA